jgi:hypothetical protein
MAKKGRRAEYLAGGEVCPRHEACLVSGWGKPGKQVTNV